MLSQSEKLRQILSICVFGGKFSFIYHSEVNNITVRVAKQNITSDLKRRFRVIKNYRGYKYIFLPSIG